MQVCLGMNRLFTLLFLFAATLLLPAQEAFRVMFYNVENLYDTINNPKTHDDDLTPKGALHWSGYRYQKKLEDVSKVISSLGGKYPPALVGICEIENRNVAADLTQRSSLARHKYKYVITNSKDMRGSNIALLYQRDQFRLIANRSYTPNLGKDKTTRDILHVTGQVVSGDTIDIFICHFPSRSEGVARSEPYRIRTARLLKTKVDGLFRKRSKANVIIMGDFNDLPTDKSLKEVLTAKSITRNIDRNSLYNLCLTPILEEGKIKSYKYRGKWDYVDQIIVNGCLLDSKNPVHLSVKKAGIYDPDFLLEEDDKYGGEKPFRTYSGWTYLGGASDHLPVYTDLYIKE